MPHQAVAYGKPRVRCEAGIVLACACFHLLTTWHTDQPTPTNERSMNAKPISKSIIALLSIATLGALTACGGNDAAANEPAPTAPAPEPKIIVIEDQKDDSKDETATTEAPAPPTTTAPSPTAAPTTPAPAPQPPIVIEQPQPPIIVQQQPQSPVIVQQTPAPVIVQQRSQPPIVYSDPWQIAPGVIENGVHYGYISSIDSSGSGFYFDRADVQADGTWSNTNNKERYLPYAHSYQGYSGEAVEVHVVDQRVAAVFSV